MFNKYYQDELRYLRDLGSEFAKAHPAAAHLLAGEGSDPDVERLLEGFAFLSARIRQKLDDELPELTHALIGLLWPHYLRPIPSMAMLEFSPMFPSLREDRMIPRGSEIESVPVEGTSCRFRTAYDVPVHPIELEHVHLDTQIAGPSRLMLKFRLHNQVPPGAMDLKSLRLFLHGEAATSYALYLHLCEHVKEVRLRVEQAGRPEGEWPSARLRIKPGGFGENENLLPHPAASFPGYGLLQEYFTLPEKFLFVELKGLDQLGSMDVEELFQVEIEFTHQLDANLRPEDENIRLYCTPIVNLFPNQGDPIRLDRTQTEYRVRPSGRHPLHYEIYSIDQVSGYRTGTAREVIFPPFYSFVHSLAERQGSYYLARLQSSVIDERVDTYLSFADAQGEDDLPAVETISLDLTCTNRRLPEGLRMGDIKIPTESSPSFAKYKNITVPKPSVAPPLHGDLHWRLISHMSLNYLSLISVEGLRGILELYNFQVIRDQRAARANVLRMKGIQTVTAQPRDFMIRGFPVRGNQVTIEMLEDHFANEGDLYLMGSILDEFIGLYVTLNSFTQLTVKGMQRGEEYSWPCRTGRQPLL
ncbi:MAG: type VI secretion system baseplate subunit TssF [Candidatus Eisenbacteria bacterium]|uniref:Type VI secretion system baseplate subunit TssF n=1 Tax=Eiseniibacteriota bacterium TaxID=2212470 RepID=A0A948WEJ5_UNCEI|nr:type VI secretion system baseplate subunit TssF [Candidatus Eisenbacteria bacterium]MBU1948373.1 type VI secretion system baseplate subunit TssF [Candidatus Eisenbacteria bacterium]MBU2692828.1 type VI secretion system baseplate subunit TssF [Candidatus Eisenbacteria bacterium]